MDSGFASSRADLVVCLLGIDLGDEMNPKRV